MFPSVLIIDDEPSILQSLGGVLTDEGFEVMTASNGYEGLKMIEAESPDIVLLDIWMPGIDGIETLKEIKKNNPFLQVIIITGHGTVETAVTATKLGAFDLIEKPLSVEKIIVTISNALNFRRLEEENKYLRKKTLEKNSINGQSPAIMALKKQIQMVAPTNSWVLIKGENGSGKELVARTIHQLSDRADNPLIDVNCAAISDHLMDAELFGQEKDAVPGNGQKKRGKFEMADNGTLFLDEIGDMHMKTQAKILRVLQEQEFQRVGGNRVIKVNVRVIAATNKDLEKEIGKGRFREDLFYRLNVVPIQVPPLRERIEDIHVLVNTFLDDFSKRHRMPKKRISVSALDLLSAYSWPGNVRELKNLIGRLMVMVETDYIEAKDIPKPYNPSQEDMDACFDASMFMMDNLEKAKERFEIEFMRKKLIQNNHDIAQAAKIMGVEPDYLTGKLNKTKESV